MTYQQVKSLKPAAFRWLCGVKPALFEQMIEVLRQHHAAKRKPGRPAKLSLEDRLLLALQYWREYRTLFHLAASWGVHEATACRAIRQVEDALIKSGASRLPGREKLLAPDRQWEAVIVDVTESPVERPKKSSAVTTAGRRNATR
jgi:hypothetical protein